MLWVGAERVGWDKWDGPYSIEHLFPSKAEKDEDDDELTTTTIKARTNHHHNL